MIFGDRQLERGNLVAFAAYELDNSHKKPAGTYGFIYICPGVASPLPSSNLCVANGEAVVNYEYFDIVSNYIPLVCKNGLTASIAPDTARSVVLRGVEPGECDGGGLRGTPPCCSSCHVCFFPPVY